MEISGTAQPASAGAATPAQSSPTTDFETFLTLLTTQMRNQDPLNPMESTQFVEQLATFTSVEQQIETNTKLDNLTAALTANDTNGLAAWLGKSVSVLGQAHYSGAPVELNFDAPPPAGARLVVRDAMGDIVADQAYSGGAWSGTLATGRDLPHGLYDFELRSAVANGDRLLAQPFVHSRVEEARMTASGPVLKLEDGRSIDADAVASIRN
ncbi:flagellar hook capping FlgD N-terminal domain-containing protein [Pontivivens nitratireducens]|uniref:flagellar hook capping FlgD N-terminal domain-containing protein n=1 Tax=Pontivivens nitratireducens TaxID=2758038 RepID=UPI00163A7DC2|nr:flagellar hook capping FlgD N-terminal domain-containing protein [Pontibrevibacter nitratireducens]